MAEENHIHAGNVSGNLVHHVFAGGVAGFDLAGGHVAIKTGVGDDNHHVGIFFRLHCGNSFAGGGDAADPVVARIVFRLLPSGDG